MKKPKFGIVAVCDAAYRDAFSNKAVIAGLFTGDILTTEYPAVLPLSFFIEIVNPQEVDAHLEFEVWVGGEMIGMAPANLDTSMPGPAVLLFSGFPVPVTGPSELELRVKHAGGSVTVLKKRVASGAS